MALGSQVRHRLWQFGWDFHRLRAEVGIDAFLAQYLAEQRVNLVIDVGARLGEYGAFLRWIGYRGHIVSFEPLPQHLTELRRHAQADGNWTVMPHALGSEAGEATITIPQQTELTSFLPHRADATEMFPGIVPDTKITIEVRRLDDMLSEILALVPDPRVYLKIDTQGFDLQVIRGAPATLERVLALQSELSYIPLYEGQPSHAEVIAELAQSRFSPAYFFAVTRTPEGCMIEADGVFLRR